MAYRVELLFREAAAELIPDGSAVLAAVSGGADSMALLHLLAGFAPRRSWRIAAAHLDHGLRRGSAADRRFVEEQAAGLRVPCIAQRRPVARLRRKDESPEEAARRVRRAFLLETAAGMGADLVAVGHTLDDQAETVLMRLVRGAGPSALSGMRSAGPGPFVRPLLSIEGAELRSYVESRGIAHREDPTNRSLAHRRNRVRHVILPLLQETLNPRAARVLVEAANRLREDAEYLDQAARRRYRRLRKVGPGGRVEMPARKLAAAHPPLARRMALLALLEAGADPRRVTARHVEALLDLARGGGGRSMDLPSGCRATRTRDRLAVHPARAKRERETD